MLHDTMLDMGRRRVLPSDYILQRWVEEGLTHKQIAQRIGEQTGYEPNRSSVSAALSKAGLTDRVRYDKFIPWSPISIDHNGHKYLQNLRVGARLDAGLKVSPESKQRFDNFVRNLTDANAIVVYLYDTDKGFYAVRREPDEVGLVRPPTSPYYPKD